MAEKKAVNNTWKQIFEEYLKEDVVAERRLNKLVLAGFSRDRVLIVLQTYAAPNAGRLLRESMDKFIPTRKLTGSLAKKCAALAWVLRCAYGSPFGVFWPEALEMLSLTDALVKGGATLVLADHSDVYSRYTVKGFWGHFPLALLYQELNIPSSLRWEDWYSLYRVAREAHGQHKQIDPKSLATNHRRFMKRFPRLKFVLPQLAKALSISPRMRDRTDIKKISVSVAHP